MQLPPGTKTIWQELDSFQAFMSDFHASIKDPARKELFGDLLQKLQQAQAEAKQVVPQVAQELKADAEKSQVEAEALHKEFERLQQELERAKAEAAKGPTVGRPPEPAVEPNLSKHYTGELLEKFGPVPEPVPAQAAAGSLWRQVDQVPNAPLAQVPEPPAVNPRSPVKPPVPPASPAQPGGGSLWRLLDEPDDSHK